MIVVVGSPIGRATESAIVAAGMSSRVAHAAARAGATVQLVGKTGDDATADGVVLDLARGGVGHVALLRESARATPIEQVLDEDDDAPVRPDAEDIVSVDAPDLTVGPAIDAADVDLGLRYLTEFGVVVVAEPAGADVIAVVSEAADWAEARMVLVIASGAAVPDGLPSDVIVFEAPDADPDGVFADLVGSFAAALDDGAEPGDAFRASIGSEGWTGVAAE